MCEDLGRFLVVFHSLMLSLLEPCRSPHRKRPYRLPALPGRRKCSPRRRQSMAATCSDTEGLSVAFFLPLSAPCLQFRSTYLYVLLASPAGGAGVVVVVVMVGVDPDRPGIKHLFRDNLQLVASTEAHEHNPFANLVDFCDSSAYILSFMACRLSVEYIPRPHTHEQTQYTTQTHLPAPPRTSPPTHTRIHTYTYTPTHTHTQSL